MPKDFTVIMSALSQNIFKNLKVNLYNFLQAKQVAAYAVTIAVGSLQKERLSSRSNVFAEKKFINEAVNTFRTGVVEKMLRIAEDLFGSYFWGIKYQLNYLLLMYLSLCIERNLLFCELSIFSFIIIIIQYLK